MKKFLFFSILLIFLFSDAVQARTWTDSKGRHLDGDYVGISENDSSKVKIKLTATGQVYSVSIKSLSPEDQNYIRARQNVDSFEKSTSGNAGVKRQPKSQNNNSEPSQISEPIKNDNPNNEVVVVEGIGDTMADAKKDAMRNAVEQVVGALVDAQTRVENDELIEQILTASGAYIEKSEVLSAKKENGLVTIKLRATVVKMSLSKKLKLGGGGQTIAVDGANLVDMTSTKADSEKSGALFLANFLKKEEFPYSLLDTKFIGQPQITQKGDEVIYTLKVDASINRARYMDFAKRVKPIIDKYAIQKSSFVLETHLFNNDITYRMSNAPGFDYKGANLPFYLCTGVMGNFRSLKFETYELPKKFSVPLGYYKRVAPVVEILLLDGDNEVVATQRAILGYYNRKEPFNAMPSMFDSYELLNPGSVGESTILNKRFSSPFRIGWSIFAPYRRDEGGYEGPYRILPSTQFDVSIVLTPEELSKVRSAKIAVIVNNPEMEKAFKTMESEIDQVPTN